MDDKNILLKPVSTVFSVAIGERAEDRGRCSGKYLSLKINNKSNEPSECLVSSEPDVGNMGTEFWMDSSKEDKQSSNGGILYSKLLQHNYLRFNIMHSERMGKGVECSNA